MKILAILLMINLGLECSGQVSSKVICTEYKDYILTHGLVPCGPVPTAFDPNGIYPYISFSETSNRPWPVKYRFIVLENDQIKVIICPDLGGKVFSMVHKASGKEVLYVPEVLRPTRILPRFSFMAGGIEVSFPVSHSPTQNNRVLYKIEIDNGRTYVTCGEKELRFGMQWSVEYSLGPADDFLTQRVIFHNPGSKTYPWMSWSNAAIPSAPDTQFDFPEGKVLSHSSVIDTIDWKSQGPLKESDILEMTGYFWKSHNVNAFGVFTSSSGSGLYHIADEAISPGIKLWSYGTGQDSTWATLSTANIAPYIEIQGGPLGDQSIKSELKANETIWHTEYWIPTDRDIDINGLKDPKVTLRELKGIPLFGWARAEEVDPWIGLQAAYKKNKKIPLPPNVTSIYWPPSGMENIKPAFEWAVKKAGKAESDIWKFYYGTWLAGSGDTSKAIKVLRDCRIGVGKALLARMLRINGDNKGAVAAYNSIEERWLQIHPQVIIERDKALRNLGKESLSERAYWLSQVDALKDEWIIERKVQLLIDKGDGSGAKELLLSVSFQKVHQTYTRTALWFQICDILHEQRLPVPSQLGEDRLAIFGAYREYE